MRAFPPFVTSLKILCLWRSAGKTLNILHLWISYEEYSSLVTSCSVKTSSKEDNATLIHLKTTKLTQLADAADALDKPD